MNTPSAIAHVVLDFDGTCTQIPKIWEAYLELYRTGLGEAGFDVTGPNGVRRSTPSESTRPRLGGRLPDVLQPLRRQTRISWPTSQHG